MARSGVFLSGVGLQLLSPSPGVIDQDDYLAANTKCSWPTVLVPKSVQGRPTEAVRCQKIRNRIRLLLHGVIFPSVAGRGIDKCSQVSRPFRSWL